MKIIFEDNPIEIEKGQTVIDVCSKIIKDKKKLGINIIACRVNNKLEDLNYELKLNDKLELLDTTTTEGAGVYQRGLLFIMARALHRMYPNLELSVNYQLTDSLYCTFENAKITDQIIDVVKTKMLDIEKRNLKIKKVLMSKTEAMKFMKKENNRVCEMQLQNTNKDKVELYQCEGYYNYFLGVMPISTGYIGMFDIQKYSKGFIIRYPSKRAPNVLDKFKENKKLLQTFQEYEDRYKALGLYTLDRINHMIRSGWAAQLVVLSEALQEKKIAGIADMIASDRSKRVILIAGPSSSGKTTFSKRLEIELYLAGLKPKSISVDNYFVERQETPKDEQGKLDFENLNAIDINLLNEQLSKILKGEEVEMPRFDFLEGSKKYVGDTISLADDEVLIMEGIHCLNDELTPLIPKDQKFKVYTSCLTVLNIDYYNRISTTDTRVIRRCVRDMRTRGYSAKDTLETWASVARGERKNIFPFQDSADVIFNSSLIYEINALKPIAQPLFEEITRDSFAYSEARRLAEFLGYFEPFSEEDLSHIPHYSINREFIGGSIFEY